MIAFACLSVCLIVFYLGILRFSSLWLTDCQVPSITSVFAINLMVENFIGHK